MSRIWDALREAERERLRATPRKSVQRLGEERDDSRRSKRLVHRVPLLVYGFNLEDQPFHEEVYTLEVNEDGCLLSLTADVTPGQPLFLINTDNQAEHECLVIHLGRRVRRKTRVVVQFPRPVPEFWSEG